MIVILVALCNSIDNQTVGDMIALKYKYYFRDGYDEERYVTCVKCRRPSSRLISAWIGVELELEFYTFMEQ